VHPGLTLHPTPYTLHPTPYTLHPTPYALHPQGSGCRVQGVGMLDAINIGFDSAESDPCTQIILYTPHPTPYTRNKSASEV